MSVTITRSPGARPLRISISGPACRPYVTATRLACSPSLSTTWTERVLGDRRFRRLGARDPRREQDEQDGTHGRFLAIRRTE